MGSLPLKTWLVEPLPCKQRDYHPNNPLIEHVTFLAPMGVSLAHYTARRSSTCHKLLYWVCATLCIMSFSDLILPFLGMHAIKDRPVVVNGEIVVRPVMVVALTYDHRLLDGREAVTFLGEYTRIYYRVACRVLTWMGLYSQGPRLHPRPTQDASCINHIECFASISFQTFRTPCTKPSQTRPFAPINVSLCLPNYFTIIFCPSSSLFFTPNLPPNTFFSLSA